MPRLTTPSVKAMPIRASAPVFPPVTSSIVRPRSLRARLVGYSSVASVESPSVTRPSQSAAWSSGNLSDGYVWEQKPRGVL